MPRKKASLTESELAIMEVLWDSLVPMSAADIVEKSVMDNIVQKKGHKLPYINNMYKYMNKLESKGMVKIVGIVPTKRQSARTFVAAMDKDDYYNHQIEECVAKMQKPSLRKILLALSPQGYSEEFLAKMEKEMEEWREKVKEKEDNQE